MYEGGSRKSREVQSSEFKIGIASLRISYLVPEPCASYFFYGNNLISHLYEKPTYETEFIDYGLCVG